jgi:hypothetical protein
VSGQALFQSESIPLNPPVARQLLPLAGAVIEIESADGSTVVAQTVTDSNGMFSIRLPPGHYILVPLSPGPLFVGNLRGTPQNFDVQAGVFTTVDAGYYSLFQFG